MMREKRRDSRRENYSGPKSGSIPEQGTSDGENTSCNLIALSTHGRKGLERWVMGSVADRLLNTTKLPMLIVRPLKKG